MSKIILNFLRKVTKNCYLYLTKNNKKILIQFFLIVRRLLLTNNFSSYYLAEIEYSCGLTRCALETLLKIYKKNNSNRVKDRIRVFLNSGDLVLFEELATEIEKIFKYDLKILNILKEKTCHFNFSSSSTTYSKNIYLKDLQQLSDEMLINKLSFSITNKDKFLGLEFNEVLKRSSDKKFINKLNKNKDLYGIELLLSFIAIMKNKYVNNNFLNNLSTLISYNEGLSFLQFIEYFNKSNFYKFSRGVSLHSSNDLRIINSHNSALKNIIDKFEINSEIQKIDVLNAYYQSKYVKKDHPSMSYILKNDEKIFKKVTKVFDNIKNNSQKKSLNKKYQTVSTYPSLFIALPRSASVYVFHALKNGLNIPAYGGVMGGAFPNFTICQEGLHNVIASRGISHTHLRASKTNLLEISERFKIRKILVHVRDPRQTILSWLEFLPRIIEQYDPVQAKHYNIPKNYLKFSQKKQLDWLVDNWYNVQVEWINEWVNVYKNHPWFKTQIHFSTFENLKKNQKVFFNNILDFYSIDKKNFEYPKKPEREGDRNFREGKTNTWKNELDKNQLKRLEKQTPEQLLNFFKW